MTAPGFSRKRARNAGSDFNFAISAAIVPAAPRSSAAAIVDPPTSAAASPAIDRRSARTVIAIDGSSQSCDALKKTG
jgi:hypothetical protein